MPTKSQSVSKRSSTRPSRPSTRKLAAEAPKKPVKRAKTKEFVHPENIPTPTSPSPPPTDKDTSNKILDISQQEFTIARCCMLGSTPVMEDTDFVKLSEFSFRGFETTSIRKLDTAAQNAKTGFQWESGTATISAKGVPMRDYLTIAVEDASGWTKVEGFVERWMRNYKQEMKVKLVIVYRKTKLADGMSSEEEDTRSKKVHTAEVVLI
jgi:hypothetical protein